MIHQNCKITFLALLVSFGLSAEPCQQQFSLQSEDELATWCAEKSSPFQSIIFSNEDGNHVFMKLSPEQGEDLEEQMIQLLARRQKTEYSSDGSFVTTEVQSSTLIQETKPFVSTAGFAGNSSIICITGEEGDEEWYKTTTFLHDGKGYVFITEVDSDWHEHPLIQEHENIVNSFKCTKI